MQIIKSSVTKKDIIEKHLCHFKDMVKVVVDVENKILAVDAERGINIYPSESEEKFIEYTSLINIRPSQGNSCMEVKNEDLRIKIQKIVAKLII